jgi:FtsZ-binding cell division protein ZapB
MTKKGKDIDQLSLAGTEEGEILARLNDRVEKAITTIQELRRERDALKVKLDEAESRLRDTENASERASSLEDECERFRRERGEIRDRVETILGRLEALDAPPE